MAMDPDAGLTPQERQLLQGNGGAATVAPSASPAPSVDTDAGLSPAERQALQPSPGPAATAPAGAPAAQPGGIGTALLAGAERGFYDVANAPAAWVGAAPTFDATLSPYQQQALQAHPWAGGIGRGVGQAATTAPAIIGATMALPEELPIIGGGLAYDAVVGAGAGAVQNMLTAGEDPNENLLRRGLSGAALGAPFGAAGGWLGSAFGTDAALASQQVADAGNLVKNAGIDVLPQNLSQHGATALAKGASANVQQGEQINRAFGNILGEDVSDFAPPTLSRLQSKIGGEVTAAANSGQVNLQPGGALDTAINQIQQWSQARGLGNQINPVINDIRNAAQRGKGVISGGDFDALVGSGSELRGLAGDANQQVAQAAQALDKAMDNGFQASSPPGAYNSWVNARTRYRMLMGIADDVEHTGGNINPTTILGNLDRRFSDLPSTTQGIVGQAGDLARSVRTLFGGGTRAAPARGGWGPLGWGLGAGSGIGAAQYLMNPPSAADVSSWLVTHPVGLGIGAGAAAMKAAQGLGRLYQESPAFANALLARGTQPVRNWLAPGLSVAGTTAAPGTINTPPPGP